MNFLALLASGFFGLCVAAAEPLMVSNPAGAARAQDAKAELDKKLEANKQAGRENDPAALFEVAVWADENNLKTDSKRLLRQVIKLDPDHAKARELLGYEKFDGKWLTKREVERERAKAEEAEMLRKGMKKWKNEYVPAEDYASLEKGLVKVDVEGHLKWVTPAEKERIEKGMTLFQGLWASREDVEHLKKGEFKVGDKYVTQDDADKVHAEFSSPWELEGELCTLTTTRPFKFAQEALRHGDGTVRQIYKMIGIDLPKEPTKVGLIMVSALADYQQLGQNVQDANDATMSSSWSTFVLSDQNTNRFIGVSLFEVLDESNSSGNDTFSLGHIRFASAAATLRNLPCGASLPPWYSIGVASYCERYWHPFHSDGVKKLAAWSIDRLNKEGGLLQLKNIFESWTVTQQTILQAGLLVSYLQWGTLNPKLKDQWTKCLDGMKAEKAKSLDKDFAKLEVLLDKGGEKEIEAYMDTVRG